MNRNETHNSNRARYSKNQIATLIGRYRESKRKKCPNMKKKISIPSVKTRSLSRRFRIRGYFVAPYRAISSVLPHGGFVAEKNSGESSPQDCFDDYASLFENSSNVEILNWSCHSETCELVKWMFIATKKKHFFSLLLFKSNTRGKLSCQNLKYSLSFYRKRWFR